MRNPGDILLISCYELGHQPLGLALPLAYLEGAGFKPATLDLSVQKPGDAALDLPRLAVISVPMHTALRLGVKIAEEIRRVNPACHIGFHGIYAALNAEYLLQSCADSVLSGECEENLARLAEALEDGRDPASLPGLHLRGRGAVPILGRQPFPLPSRSPLQPLSRYACLQLEEETKTAGYVEASRGCLHHCRHCPIPPVYSGRFFVVPQDRVLSDIRQQVEMGAAHITFGDPDFLNGPGHALAVARETHQRFPSLTFDFTAKIEHLLRYRSLLPELRRLGALFVVSAVESLSDEVLRILDKGHTREDVMEALALCREAGLTLRPSLVPFTPWSTLQDFGRLLEWVEEEDLVDAVDPVQLSVRLLIPPGSLLLDRPEMAPHLRGFDPSGFSHLWVHPDPRMDSLQRRVSLRAERAAHEKEDPETTCGKISKEYSEAAGEEKSRFEPSGLSIPRRRVPRLTESWFC